ncbi:unnamed protein product [Bemisia tabaci]|uniref:AAA-ATPase-like domain-containing protein n=1 Tax=Bemisia tabaci TaxID=7038 RepID=A0A9P0A324_BEMTA|nr:unnamed protein product [Bemisia tabaci]
MGRFTFFCVLAAVFDTTKQQLIRVMESNFSEIVYSPYFTDKTMFIKYFMREPKHLMVLAPQGFGKSTILSMLQLFLDLQADRNGTIIQPNTTQNAPFFERVKIRREEEYYERHFAQHPVLYLNLKHLACHPSYLVFGRTFRDMIVRMLLKYKYLLRSRILVSRAPQEYYSCFKLLFQSNFNPEHFVLMGRRMTRSASTEFHSFYDAHIGLKISKFSRNFSQNPPHVISSFFKHLNFVVFPQKYPSKYIHRRNQLGGGLYTRV